MLILALIVGKLFIMFFSQDSYGRVGILRLILHLLMDRMLLKPLEKKGVNTDWTFIEYK